MPRPILAGVLAALALALTAQSAAPVASPPGSPDYKIGVDDILQVGVRPRMDLNTQVTVLADGTISLPSLGPVHAEGMTVKELSSELTRRFGLYDRDITQVTVTVLAYNSQKVFLLGEVYKPGRYAFPVIPGIWDVVREGGGPTSEADLTAVQVIRGEGEKRETITVDLGSAITSGNFDGLPKLRPGDTVRLLRKQVTVPPKDQVYVMGEVRSPGIFSTQTASDVVSAIMAAGGPTTDADLSEITLTRRNVEGTRSLELDLKGYETGDRIPADLALKPGDAISVPSRSGGLLHGLLPFNTVLPLLQVVISTVIAIESIRVARGTP
ncbi:MAG TPA: polysaccharide biosynthesis/export family protein [Candidatus Saccharimonadales bacterium]|nr:polysaccharide biosynthesis/export family protein [Candidatus Saccharimonadales bacterium]